MRGLAVSLSLVMVASTCAAVPPCPASPVRIAFGDRAAGAFLRGNGPEFDPTDPGIVVLEVRAAVKTVGCPATLVRLPHKRLLAEMDSGSIDFAVGYTDTVERLERWRFPQGADGSVDPGMAVGQSAIRWVVLRDRRDEQQQRWSEGQLSGRLGALQDTLAERLAAGAGLKTASVLNLNEVAKLLTLRHFDAIALPTMPYAEVLSQQAQNLATLEPALGQMLYYAPASRTFAERSPAYVRALWQALCDEARRRQTSPGCKR